MSYPLLNNICSPGELKSLAKERIPELCEQIRAFLIENVSKTGGHLASNLGVVELTVALHRVFDSPKDHLIFDVGHQAYVHKLLTGRREAFSTLRTPGGLSGFTSMKESVHDAFGAGHSSTSLSAALGYAEADRLRGDDSHTVCIIGDGAYTGGMIHEALNNCKRDLPLVIVLNENRMSISHNRGAFASYLSRVRTSERYRAWKRSTKRLLNRHPRLRAALRGMKEFIKRRIYPLNYFEELGLYYIGGVDGNDYAAVERALYEAKRLRKCVIVHIKTKKGKGHEDAERAPDLFHSLTGRVDGDTFHSVFADRLIEDGAADAGIVAITAAMGIGTGLDSFGERFPERYFDVGIAEEHALTFAAGLAAGGLKPYAVIYSTFLQRAYDNILHDVALQDLPVRMIIDRAGLALSDGATHHGIFDVAFLLEIPHITLYTPATYGALCRALAEMKDATSPTAVRYPNCSESERVRCAFYPDGEDGNIGVRANFSLQSTPKNVYITYGVFAERVLLATEILKEKGIGAGVVLLEKLTPPECVARELLPYLDGASAIVFAEEGILEGGAGMVIGHWLSSLGALNECSYAVAAIRDFAAPDAPCDLYDHVGLSPERLAAYFLPVPKAPAAEENSASHS